MIDMIGTDGTLCEYEVKIDEKKENIPCQLSRQIVRALAFVRSLNSLEFLDTIS